MAHTPNGCLDAYAFPFLKSFRFVVSSCSGDIGSFQISEARPAWGYPSTSPLESQFFGRIATHRRPAGSARNRSIPLIATRLTVHHAPPLELHEESYALFEIVRPSLAPLLVGVTRSRRKSSKPSKCWHVLVSCSMWGSHNQTERSSAITVRADCERFRL